MANSIKVSQMQLLENVPDNAKIYIVVPGNDTPLYTTKQNLLAQIWQIVANMQVDINELEIQIQEIPEQVNADWNATSGPEEILNKPNLAPVATSNNYNDLDNLPTIPGTPNIQQVLEQGDTSTIPFTVSGTNSKAVHSSKGYDVQETDGTTVLTTELVSKQVRHVKKVNGTEAGRTELEYEEPTIQAKITVPNKTGTMALLSDIEANQSSGLLVEYTHTANQEIYINAIDYATGIVTTTTPHGLTGTLISNVGIFVNGLNNTATFDINNVKTIPYEYVTNRVYITVVNASQLKITNSSGGVIAVNTTSTENNNNLDISKWHIEILKPYSIDIPNGNKKISVEYFGLAVGTIYQYKDYSFWENNAIVPPILIPNQLSYIGHMGFTLVANNINSVQFSQKMLLNLLDGRMYHETWVQNSGRTSGFNDFRLSINTFYKHPQIGNFMYLSGRNTATGISEIKAQNYSNAIFSNYTKIKVYKS